MIEYRIACRAREGWNRIVEEQQRVSGQRINIGININ